MRGDGAERGHAGLPGLTYRSEVLDKWAELNHIMVQEVTIYVLGPLGFLFAATTVYPVARRLHLLPEGVTDPAMPQIQIDLAEFWFNEYQSFAVYDCTGRVPETYRLVIH